MTSSEKKKKGQEVTGKGWVINNYTLKSNYRHRQQWLPAMESIKKQSILSQALFILRRRLIGCYCGNQLQLQWPNMVQVCTHKGIAEGLVQPLARTLSCCRHSLFASCCSFGSPFCSWQLCFSRHGLHTCRMGNGWVCSAQQLVHDAGLEGWFCVAGLKHLKFPGDSHPQVADSLSAFKVQVQCGCPHVMHARNLNRTTALQISCQTGWTW